LSRNREIKHADHKTPRPAFHCSARRHSASDQRSRRDHENFMVRTTADYVALCDSPQGSENYVAAIHFCQGFASGAYQYYLALAQHDASSRFVCPPDPTPSRNEVIANFLAWARANPQRLAEPAVESLFRYLGETYPCSAAPSAPQ
jgi:hypothetical protein